MERLILENQLAMMQALDFLMAECPAYRAVLWGRIDATKRALEAWSVTGEGSGDVGHAGS
jgi:hypothetical protein